MNDGPMVPQMPLGEAPRYQPEFSTGERLRGIESDLSALDRRFSEVRDLFDEKLDGLRKELSAISNAQKEAVDKSEKSTTQRFDTFIEQNDRKAEVTQSRLAALERGESAGAGKSQGVSELKTSTVAWIGAFAAVALVLLYIAHP